jgi:hypothetical protein
MTTYADLEAARRNAASVIFIKARQLTIKTVRVCADL